MDNPADIALVDAHTKGDSGTNHLDVVLFEHLLSLVALILCESCMVNGCFDTMLLQVLSHFLRILPAQTIDDAAIQGACLDEVQDILVFLLGGIATLDGQAKVGAVEAGNKETGILQTQLFDDVLTRHLVGSSRQRHNGDIWEFAMEDIQLGVFRTEIVTPLANTMGFVDGKE